jgi:thiol-disulfide isomerase/thioredoxin
MQRRNLLNAGLLLAGAAAAGPFAMTTGCARSGSPAPAFEGLGGWMNTSAPITLDALRGNVVLVNFWTYSCINSRRPMVYLKRWHTEYGPLGLRVIGIHTPEFRFEHARSNVEAYVREAGITFPVALDNDFRTWEAWGNDAWPGFYLLDRQGRIVLSRLGEDHAHEIETAIRTLLQLPSTETVGRPGDDPDLSRIGSPELYFGAKHPTPQDSRQSPRPGAVRYSFDQTPRPDLGQYALDGEWSREGEQLVLRSARGGLRLRYSAADLHLVAAAPETSALRIHLDGREMPAVEVSWPTLYTLVRDEPYGEHLLEFETGTPGLTLFSATFG